MGYPFYVSLFVFNPGPVVDDPQDIVKYQPELMVGKRGFFKGFKQAFNNFLFKLVLEKRNILFVVFLD